MVLDDLKSFCRKHRVNGHVCLTGGDPLYYREFWALYAMIAQYSFEISLLGNPIGDDDIIRLQAIKRPRYYQVSLEGLRAHNDYVRGAGHFELTRDFLIRARRLGLRTRVMLTLTRANLDQVIPLGNELRGLTGRFTFNRLAAVGEAKDLQLPDRCDYAEFLRAYTLARRANPVLGFKDSLFNILRLKHRERLMGGCTGFGCGAAFNFVALLPDGEVHACRKFPSLIGNIKTDSWEEIYQSEAARQYRAGPESCRDCRLRPVCGGCQAVVYGSGKNPLQARDPHCFLESA
jgi:selenobiotic family peptide radical SAM maturase